MVKSRQRVFRFVDYRETILEKQTHSEIHADPFVGVNIDLVDPLAYVRTESTVKAFVFSNYYQSHLASSS